MSKTSFKRDRLVIVRAKQPTNLNSVAEAVVSEIPELQMKNFVINEKKGVATYCSTPKVHLNGRKIVLMNFEIRKISDTTFQIHAEYRKRIFRPFLLTFSLAGIVCGIIPGLMIYWVFHETDDDINSYVQPALERFEGLVKSSPVFAGV